MFITYLIETLEKFTLINYKRKGIKVFEPFEYVSKPGPTINEMVICNNNYVFNKHTPTEYWRLLTHESAQLCKLA